MHRILVRYGAGRSTSGKLTPKQSNNLTSIWKAVVEASGGEFVSNDYIAVSNDTNATDSLPSVSVVDIPSDTPIVFDSDVLDETDTEESNAFDEPVALEESQVQFVGDEAAYLNPEAALETIRPIADYLANTNPSLSSLSALQPETSQMNPPSACLRPERMP